MFDSLFGKSEIATVTLRAKKLEPQSGSSLLAVSSEGGGNRPCAACSFPPWVRLIQMSSIPCSLHSLDPGQAIHEEALHFPPHHCHQREGCFQKGPLLQNIAAKTRKSPRACWSWTPLCLCLSFSISDHSSLSPPSRHAHLLSALVPTAAFPPRRLKCHQAATEGHAVFAASWGEGISF